MSNIKLATPTADAMVNAAVDLIDAGGAAGTINIYDGVQPATADDLPGGTLLGTLTFSLPAFGASATATATAAAITSDSSADASGTAAWFRVLDSLGATIFDGDVTVTGGGGDLELDDVNIVAGGVISVTSFTFHQPRFAGD